MCIIRVFPPWRWSCNGSTKRSEPELSRSQHSCPLLFALLPFPLPTAIRGTHVKRLNSRWWLWECECSAGNASVAAGGGPRRRTAPHSAVGRRVWHGLSHAGMCVLTTSVQHTPWKEHTSEVPTSHSNSSVNKIFRCVRMVFWYSYCSFGHCPSSCLLFKTREG
jgi:hypothetical protein